MIAASHAILHMRENGDIIVTTDGWIIYAFFVAIFALIGAGAWRRR